jgi:heme/copper-type cytochrome/quinol oxidase subunit 3
VKKNLGGGNGKMEQVMVNDVVFIVSDALTFSGFLAAYGFDLNLLKHGHWR